MSIYYQVNIAIHAGCDFAQEFWLAAGDKAPLNITGYKFKAAIAKHSDSLDAVLSTSDNPVAKCYPLNTRVVDGVGGIYEVSMPKEATILLEEGKYFYNVVTQDTSGVVREVVSGLAFVEKSLASTCF